MSDNRPSTSWAVWAWQAYQEGRLVEAHALPADPRVEKLVEAAKAARIVLAEYEPHPLPVLKQLLVALAAWEAGE
jgi:hypothetical protein